MGILSEEILSGDAVLRVYVESAGEMEHVLEDMHFINYRLASVSVRSEVKKAKADVIWDRAASEKGIRYVNDQLLLTGNWEQGELNKIMVAMMGSRMDREGIHPFHSSSVRFKDRTILFLGGENNHGKSMSQIEGCRRGGLLISTETTVTDDEGIVISGSKNVYVGPRAKGTERADLPSQDEGVRKFFDKEPEYKPFEEKAPVDLVIMPGMDGHFATQVIPMKEFEREYQTFHSVMNYLGLNQLLSPGGLVMPIIDSDELRVRRGDFVRRFAQDKPYYMVRAKNPGLLWDEVENVLAKEGLV